MTDQDTRVSITEANLSLQNFFITYLNPSRTAGDNDTGGLQADIYSNGVMRACLFIGYSYTLGDEEDAIEADDLDAAVQTSFLTSTQNYVYTLQNPNTRIQDLGWTLVEGNNQFRNDINHEATGKPAPQFNAATGSYTGYIRVFATPPTDPINHKLKVYGANTAIQVTNTLDLSCNILSLETSDLALNEFQMIGKQGNFTRLLALGYSSSANIPEKLKLKGIEKDGKYGLTLSVSYQKTCNINMTYIKDDNAKVAGFFDHHLSPQQYGESGFKLILGKNDDSILGTDFKGPDDDGQSGDNEGTFWCNDGDWEECETFSSTALTAAFQFGVPMVAALDKDDLKVRLDNSNGKRYLINYHEKLQYAFDNCGNRVCFEIHYHKRDWEDDWYNPNKTWPIVLTRAYASGGCNE